MTRGQYRVGIGFNPSGDDMVARVKRAAAELIDLVDGIEPPRSPDGPIVALDAEVTRCKALAMTAIEEAAMWAVKAATKQAPTS